MTAVTSAATERKLCVKFLTHIYAVFHTHTHTHTHTNYLTLTNLMFCWPCIIATKLHNKHKPTWYTLHFHFHFHYHFIEDQSLDMFRALLAHLQEALHGRRFGGYCVRLYMCVGLGMWEPGYTHSPRPTHIYNRTQYSPNLRSCSASWRWVSNARNMSRLWTSIKW
jgi:hypothetical protein